MQNHKSSTEKQTGILKQSERIFLKLSNKKFQQSILEQSKSL